MIIQVENAVSDDDCRRLMTIYDRHVQQTKVKDQTGHPVVYSDQFRDTPDAAEIVPRLVERCLCSIRHQLQLTDPLYLETVSWPRWVPEGTIADMPTIVGRTNKAIGSPITRPSAT